MTRRPIAPHGGVDASRGRWTRPGRLLRDFNMVALLALVGASSALLLLPRTDDGLLGLPDLELGDRSPRTIKSPTRLMVEDRERTNEMRSSAASLVPPTYDRLLWMGETIKNRIADAFAAAAEKDPADRSQAFVLGLGVTVDEAQLAPIIEATNPDELRDAVIMVAQTIYEAPVVRDRQFLALKLSPYGVVVRMTDRDGTVQREVILHSAEEVLGIDQARARVDAIVADKLERLPVEQRRAVAWVVKKLLAPSLVPNDVETDRRRAQRASSVKPVFLPLEVGDPIIRAGDAVNRQHLMMLEGLAAELEAQSRLQAAAGSALLMVVLVIFSYRVARRSYRPRPRFRDLAFLASTFVVMLFVLWVGYKGVLYLGEVVAPIEPAALRFVLPVAFGALLVRLVAGVEAAAVFAPVVGLAAGWVMDGSLGFAAYAILGSLGAASTADSDRPRSLIWSAGLRICLGQIAAVVALALLASNLEMEAILPSVGVAVISAAVSAIAAAVVLPVIELLFGFTTLYRLSDLANLNHPLLRELLVEAPGTYHHSILVGTLAEAGAQSMNAHTLLARVGGYYHDIGKIKNPRLYSENDEEAFPGLLPEDHARELRSHVTDGLELSAKHRLGQPVQEIIAQHHGTGVVRAALARAQERSQGGVEVDLFRYRGPPPSSREGALVLLADVVETATRPLGSQVGLTRARIEGEVRHLITEVLEEGQLDQSDITLRDLGRVVAAFTDVLEERLVRRGRPPTLSALPAPPALPLVRPPPGGEPN